MEHIAWKIHMMDMISPLMVMTGLWLLVGLGFLWWGWGRRHTSWLVMVLACVWIVPAQWLARANWNYRWVDEPALYVLHEAWLKGLENGQQVIPMHKVWNERWKYMCISLPYQNMYWYEGGNYTVQQVLGVASEQGMIAYDSDELFIGDGKGYFVTTPEFGRFKFKNMQRFAFREYYYRLKGQGYTWMFVKNERPEIEIDQGCYNLKDISIRFIKK